MFGWADFETAWMEKDSSSLVSPRRRIICRAFRVAKTELLYTFHQLHISMRRCRTNGEAYIDPGRSKRRHIRVYVQRLKSWRWANVKTLRLAWIRGALTDTRDATAHTLVSRPVLTVKAIWTSSEHTFIEKARRIILVYWSCCPTWRRLSQSRGEPKPNDPLFKARSRAM
jgi:hypothetical protein